MGQGGAFGQLEAGVLEVEHALSKGLAALGVLHRQFDGPLDHRRSGHGQQQALVGQLAHQLAKALAFLPAEQLVRFQAHAVKEQLGGVRRMLAQLLQPPADTKAGQVFGLQHHQRDTAAARPTGAHGDHQQVGSEAVGDEGFGAVDHIVVTVFAGLGAQRFQIGATAGLGQCDTREHLSAGQPGQPALLLLLGAVVQDVVRSNGVHGRVGGHFGAGQFVLHHQLVGQVGAGAAVRLGHLGQQKTQLAKRPPDLARDKALAAPAVQVRHEFFGDVALGLFSERLDVFVHPGMAVQLGQQAHGIRFPSNRRCTSAFGRSHSRTRGCTAGIRPPLPRRACRHGPAESSVPWPPSGRD